jgi:hypothetical protein
MKSKFSTILFQYQLSITLVLENTGANSGMEGRLNISPLAAVRGVSHR